MAPTYAPPPLPPPDVIAQAAHFEMKSQFRASILATILFMIISFVPFTVLFGRQGSSFVIFFVLNLAIVTAVAVLYLSMVRRALYLNPSYPFFSRILNYTVVFFVYVLLNAGTLFNVCFGGGFVLPVAAMVIATVFAFSRAMHYPILADVFNSERFFKLHPELVERDPGGKIERDDRFIHCWNCGGPVWRERCDRCGADRAIPPSAQAQKPPPAVDPQDIPPPLEAIVAMRLLYERHRFLTFIAVGISYIPWMATVLFMTDMVLDTIVLFYLVALVSVPISTGMMYLAILRRSLYKTYYAKLPVDGIDDRKNIGKALLYSLTPSLFGLGFLIMFVALFAMLSRKDRYPLFPKEFGGGLVPFFPTVMAEQQAGPHFCSNCGSELDGEVCKGCGSVQVLQRNEGKGPDEGQ